MTGFYPVTGRRITSQMDFFMRNVLIEQPKMTSQSSGPVVLMCVINVETFVWQNLVIVYTTDSVTTDHNAGYCPVFPQPTYACNRAPGVLL